MTYHLAERFKSLQGEGNYVGTPMAFIRFVGCSVGKTICQHCDTAFEGEYEHLGGGEYTPEQLAEWAKDVKHVCLTGGEPLDQDLEPFWRWHQKVHIETSGTVFYGIPSHVYVCVSPKPGYREDMIERADEVKVIVPGLGNGKGWPNVAQAVTWADRGKLVFLQPRNARWEVDFNNLRVCEELVRQHPNLRLSTQLHKILKVR